ncbi:MAG: tRNA pseudouridine(38-40) synthase TruA [bacterium]|nr:tRNA pseudouridine(38-40) synthase TruA [bacterium]
MNIKLTLAFNGLSFYGWQKQSNKKGVQDYLELAIQNIYKEKVKVVGCSRTDRNVSAINYILNFKPPFFIEENKIPKALNHYLPEEIIVKLAEYVHEEFHSRYDAKSKVYIYRIGIKKSIFDSFYHYENDKLNIIKMKDVIKVFKGKHNFKAFSIFNDKNSNCEIFYANIYQVGNFFYFIIKGDRFLHKMVRFIVGAVLEVGRGILQKEDLENNLLQMQRIHQIKPVIGNGLFLSRVIY